ncbi:MAG TPA: heat-inducible transcriptional repressor HrcA [Patescibacteria group bacterium]|jgi:heat-inducible transcriptional repressor|nr:heat-inducible transcriptional repressor HrcA [Patescibacteria group bacterium]
MINELNERAQEILRFIVDSYMETGEPVGSRTIARATGLNLSPASIRNVMADLEAEGLLFAPHTSAGRLPTQRGLRFYVDGLMQIGSLSEQDRCNIEAQCATAGETMNQVLERATSLLAGLSAAAGLVVAPKTDKPVRQIQFVQLEPGKVLVVLVMQDNMVENRVMDVPQDLPASALTVASNYLNDRLAGKTLFDAARIVNTEIEQNRAQLDRITTELVQRGLALAPQSGADGHIIIRGQSKLLQDVRAMEDLEKARQLLAALEEQETASRLLEAANGADGIQVFIGTENRVFENAGWSMVISPYRTPENRFIGAIGVIGPARLNYGRIIPVVDYTARVMGRLIGT